jgi:hypothetical protein
MNPHERESNMRSVLALTLLLAWCVAACGEEATGGEEAHGALAAAKSDCPDCDPAGPNAFVQTGLGADFYREGQSWQVAYRYNAAPTAEMRDDVFLGEDEATSEVYLFDYSVTSLGQTVRENTLRQTATVKISQATPTGPSGDLFSPGRVDTHEFAVAFTMNDLLEPMRETVYSRRYPNGKSVELDPRASLQTGASVFPKTLPRLLVSGSVAAPAPDLPADLRDVADQLQAGWDSALYKKHLFGNGDVVYWTVDQGQYWPFYTRTRAGESLLVAWNQ